MIIVPLSESEEEPPAEVIDRFTHTARQGVSVYLTGVDGSTWDLVAGPVKMQEGVRLAFADPEHRLKTSAALDGATWEGFRTPPGELYLPVRVEASNSLEWRDADAAFSKAIDPSGEVLVTVITPDAKSRSVTGRYEEGQNASLLRDPLMMRHAVYPLSFRTLDPFWRAPRRRIRFGVDDGENFFPGPPFLLSPGSTTDSATATNRGDVPAWPKWTIDGPLTSVTVGVGESVVTLGVELEAGESRIIDMDPRQNTIVDGDGADAWLDATDAAFAPIPVGVEVPLSIDVAGGEAGTTEVALEFTPGHRKPW